MFRGLIIIIIIIIIVIIMNIQCNDVIEARLDIVVVNKQERKHVIVDFAVPGDKRIGEKENEKVEECQEL